MRRFERADQYRVCDAFRLADEVQAPVDPVRAVDVGVAGRPEHRLVALRPTAIAVRRRVFVVVGLELDDDPADAVDKQCRPDQLGGELVHAPREELSSERRHVSLWRFAS